MAFDWNAGKPVGTAPTSPSTQPTQTQKPVSDNPIIRAFQDPNSSPEQKQAVAQVVQHEAEKQKSALEKFTSFFTEGKGLQAGANMLINPIGKELIRPFVSTVRGVQELVPGGKTGKESVDTPFGEVKPYRELSAGEAAMGAIDTVTSLPGAAVGEKILKKGAEYTVKPALKLGEKIFKGTGEAIYKSAITPTVQEAERILAYKAKTPFLKRVSNYVTDKVPEIKPILRSDTALEQGIKGTESQVGIKSKRIGDKLWNETIAPAVKNSEAVVTKADLFAPIEERIIQTTDPSKKKALAEAFDALKEDYGNTSQFSLEQAQKLKSELDAFTPEKIFKGKNVANEFKILQNDMADAIRAKTYDALKNQNIRKAYLDWANLKELQKVGVTAISESKLKGGFGNFWSGMWNMATVPVKTIGGRTLYRVGDTFEFVGDKGINKFSTFLIGRGFQRPEEK